jgi:DNA-directed RNA polymerase subunit omega
MMAEPRSTMIDPPIETLLDKVDSKFTLVTLSAKRGRQINSYFNQLGEGLGAIVPPQVISVARKPLSIALEEIAAKKVNGVYPPDEEPGADAAAGDVADDPFAFASSGERTLEAVSFLEVNESTDTSESQDAGERRVDSAGGDNTVDAAGDTTDSTGEPEPGAAG